MVQAVSVAYWQAVLLALVFQTSYAQVSSPEVLYGHKRSFSEDTATVRQLIVASRNYPNDPDSAIRLLDSALSLSKSVHYPDGCARAMLGVGTNLFNKGELEKSKAVFVNTYPYLVHARQKKRELLLFWYNNMASVYTGQGHYDTAAFFYYKALDNVLSVKDIDSGFYSIILGNLATVWQKGEQYSKSLYYSRKGMAIALARHDSDRMADFYQSIGLALDGLGEHANGIRSLQASYAINLKRHNFLKAQMDCCALAVNTDNQDTALFYYNTALALSRRTSLEPLHQIYVGLGYTYLELKNYTAAARFLNQALAKAGALGYSADLGLIYAGLARVYTATHEYQLANKYQKAYSDIRDTLVKIEKIQTTNTLEIKYRTTEKDREITAARLQLMTRDYRLKQQRNWIIFISCMLTFLVIIIISFYSSLQRRKKLEKQQLLNLEQQREISNLKSVMSGEEKERTRIARELHDGIMVQLAVVKMKLRKLAASPAERSDASMDTILEQLDNTSRELRQTAHNLMPDMLLENGLTDALFYQCSSLQKETGLDILFQHYGALPRLVPEAELYLYRIVQELMQNIIKHAHATKALVQMNYHPPLLSFSVEDNGVGFNNRAIDPGMGLKSIYSRLRILNGTIDIQSRKYTGTTIFIELNIETLIQTDTTNHADTRSHS